MTIERSHKGGGFVKLRFYEFFSEMPSTDCSAMLNLLINDYGVSPYDIDEKFRVSLAAAQTGKRRIHLLNSYRIFIREHMDESSGRCKSDAEKYLRLYALEADE